LNVIFDISEIVVENSNLLVCEETLSSIMLLILRSTMHTQEHMPTWCGIPHGVVQKQRQDGDPDKMMRFLFSQLSNMDCGCHSREIGQIKMGRREVRESNVLHGSWLLFMITDHGYAARGPAAAAGSDPAQLLCFSASYFSTAAEGTTDA
jgi:hypothetical protein